MPSFDTVLEPNLVEVKNAVENTAKEIATRFDFKGTSAAVELKDKEITMFGDADFQLVQVEDVLRNKLTKREVDVRFLDKGDVQKIGGDKVKQVIKIRNGIETEVSKKIQRLLKDSKIKVQAAIQGDSVRVTGAKRDDLHSRRLAIAFLHQKDTVQKLFSEIAPASKDRQGGYCRITKLGARMSDSAPMAIIEWVDRVAAGEEAPVEEVAATEAVEAPAPKKAAKKKAAEAVVEVAGE